MKGIWISLFIFMALIGHTQIRIEGLILDSVTHEPLPFVNIAEKGTTKGCVSTMNGKFAFDSDQLPVTLLISFVGYTKKEITIPVADKKITVYLSPTSLNLAEVTVVSGPDPGWLFMKKVVERSDVNNPEKNCSFSYLSYNKLLFTLDADEPTIERKIDSLKHDSVAQADYVLFKKQHLFISESVSERKYKSASQNKETILAAKVSGFKTPAFTLLSTQLQSFHFYKGEISLSEVKYIGPVSQAGLKHYRFVFTDTLYIGKDTVFSLRYFAKKEGDVRSLKGVIQISTDGYAIYSVIAEPEIIPETGFAISIFQQYEKVENKQWFPIELNTTLMFPSIKMDDFALKGVGTGIISDIKLNPDFARREFDEIEIRLGDSINVDSEKILSAYRSDSLTKKEIYTYRAIDSIGQKYKLDRKISLMQSLLYGYVPVKFLDWDIGKLFGFNDYEGFRLNAAFRSNHKISKWFSVGGYLGYGFKDRAWKYGTDLNIVFSRKKQVELNFLACQDVEAGSEISNFERKNNFSPYGYSEFFLSRYDSVQRYQGRFSFRALRHFKFTFFGNYQIRNAYSDYQYASPANDVITVYNSSYDLAEIGTEIKIAIHEKFVETPFGYFSQGTKWPMIYIRYTKGITGIQQASFDYQRITFLMNYSYSHLRLGTLFFGLKAGMVTGEAPYHLLFSPVGTYRPINKLTVYSMDGFETMRTNEFIFDKLVTLHTRYKFAKPIVQVKKFKPFLSLSNSIAYGEWNSDRVHLNLNSSGADKAFLESGIIIDNILKSGISGIGIGAFYRWGPMKLPEQKENLAIKISLSLSLS